MTRANAKSTNELTGPGPLGEALKRLRSQRGLSLRGLAKKAGVDPTWLLRVERGDYEAPDARLLRDVASALGIETSELFLVAGYEEHASLPQFAPYLRSKYALPEDAIRQLEDHFHLVNEKYRRRSAR
jgi:transcriptional regulator with XRE-family HTH domain